MYSSKNRNRITKLSAYGEYVDGSFDVTVDDDELIRECYNKGQQDERIENPEEVSGNACAYL